MYFDTIISDNIHHLFLTKKDIEELRGFYLNAFGINIDNLIKTNQIYEGMHVNEFINILSANQGFQDKTIESIKQDIFEKIQLILMGNPNYSDYMFKCWIDYGIDEKKVWELFELVNTESLITFLNNCVKIRDTKNKSSIINTINIAYSIILSKLLNRITRDFIFVGLIIVIMNIGSVKVLNILKNEELLNKFIEDINGIDSEDIRRFCNEKDSTTNNKLRIIINNYRQK